MSLRYLVIYPDGSRAKIKEAQKAEMLRDGLIRAVDAGRFHYIGESFHFRSFADLRFYKHVITSTRFCGYYPGVFIWEEPDGQQHKEALESPEKMAIRLRLAGEVE